MRATRFLSSDEKIGSGVKIHARLDFILHLTATSSPWFQAIHLVDPFYFR